MLDQIHLGDCLEVMRIMPSGSVDMILCDLPYGVTQNKWDSLIDLDKLFAEYQRVCPLGNWVLFGQDKFTARLMLMPNHRYNLIWDKQLISGFLNANRQPLRRHEDICIFYKKLTTYNPQFTQGKPNNGHRKQGKKTSNYGNFKFIDDDKSGRKHPHSIISFQKVAPGKQVHPTEKPLELIEWLIRTYSNPGDVVLDNCSGSGVTAVGCLRNGRRFICIEKDEGYHAASEQRVIDELI